MNAGLSLLRFFLAVNVVAFHLWNAAAPGAGPVAVLGFFFVSGYLITQIVQEVYAAPGRAGAFLLNRALRIYPPYVVALGLSLFVIWLYPDVAAHANSYLRWPQGAAEWLPQLFIVGLDHASVRVLPATWTLGTELYFYALIGLWTARSRRASIALCVVSLPVGALCALHDLPFNFYGSPVGNGFVFGLGSLTYFYRHTLRVRPALFALAGLAYAIHLYAVPALEHSDIDAANLAGSVLPFALILLFLVQQDVVPARWAALSQLLGRIAYPVFLLHWAVSVLVSAWLFHGLASFDQQGMRAGGVFFAVVLAAVIACALLFYGVVDRPIEKLRSAVRRPAAKDQ